MKSIVQIGLLMGIIGDTILKVMSDSGMEMTMRYRKIIFAAMAGLISGFCIIAGESLDVSYTLNLTEKSFYIKWLICSAVIGFIVHILWEVCSGRIQIPEKIRAFIEKQSLNLEKIEKKMSFPILMLILLLLWTPAWLSVFPGVFSYDAYDEWMQIHTGNITAHHPVLHVLYLGGIVEGAYQLFGSYNLGIAICTVIQMVVLAAVFAYTIQFMRERGVSLFCRLFAVIFYGFSPVIQLFAISGTKDIFFTASFLVFMISIYRICLQRELFFQNKKWMFLFIISAVFTMIMRNNGLYIVLAVLPIIYIYRYKQTYMYIWDHLKKYLLMCVAVMSIYLLYIGPFYGMLNVTAGGMEEMLSVPLQQLARVYTYEQDSFSEEEIEYLHTIVPQKNWESYRATVSDFVKSGFREEVFAEDPLKFLLVWAKTGWEHPLTYINSFLINTVDFWYPFAVVDGYQDVYGKSSYFDYRVSEPGTEVALLPKLHEIYDAISHDKETQSLPGMFLILSPGWYLLLFFMLFLYLWREKQYHKLIPLLPVLINFGTVLLGPIALVRYVLILFFAFPMYGVFMNNK